MQKNIQSSFINDTVNWNDTISNLWGQSNEKVLQLTGRHVVPQLQSSLVCQVTH